MGCHTHSFPHTTALYRLCSMTRNGGSLVVGLLWYVMCFTGPSSTSSLRSRWARPGIQRSLTHNSACKALYRSNTTFARGVAFVITRHGSPTGCRFSHHPGQDHLRDLMRKMGRRRYVLQISHHRCQGWLAYSLKLVERNPRNREVVDM